MGHLILNPEPCLIDHCDDPGILRKTGNTGKRGSKNHQKTIPHSCRETPARCTGTGIPGTRSIRRDRTCPAHRQVLPPDQRPLPGLLALYLFSRSTVTTGFTVIAIVPEVRLLQVTCRQGPNGLTLKRPGLRTLPRTDKTNGLSPMKRAYAPDFKRTVATR